MSEKPQKKKSEIVELLETAFFSFIFVLILTTFFIKPVRVYGSSMYPTLHDGDTGFSSIISLKIATIKRFDIVVVDLDSANEHLVKRIIGLPNEQVCYQDDKLYIDGAYVEESFLDEDYTDTYDNGSNFTKSFGCVVLGADEYFVMGDNRPYSSDSRYYGTFTEDQIISKGVFVIWPFSDFGFR
ncbi:Signal peptidase I T [bioreactor metagenome]|uniref:signal peptidase I n=1 Tax=bioreactor metagenome TaxID=1076179 RepID=A0A645CE10_9ZZZZ|nr:signal peptidase I [Erysipelotrichaceae bacterium]